MLGTQDILFRVGFILATMLHLSNVANCLPLQGSDSDEAAVYNDLQEYINDVMLSNLAADSASAYQQDLSLPRPRFFRHAPRGTPTDTPTLSDLVRSAVETELRGFNDGASRKSLGLSKSMQLMKDAMDGRVAGSRASKRSFDSISRSSGFGGMNRGSWGSSSRNGENLTFTFESLFPAIARGLRSSN